MYMSFHNFATANKILVVVVGVVVVVGGGGSSSGVRCNL